MWVFFLSRAQAMHSDTAKTFTANNVLFFLIQRQAMHSNTPQKGLPALYEILFKYFLRVTFFKINKCNDWVQQQALDLLSFPN